MSYARSPRPLCSMTIGTIPSPCGSAASARAGIPVLLFIAESPCRASRPLAGAAHQLIKRDGCVDDLRMLEHPTRYVVLQRRAFKVGQALAVRKVPVDDFRRSLVA